MARLWRAPAWRLSAALLLGAVLLLLTAGVADAQAFPPRAVSEQGEATRTLYLVVFGFAVAVFIVVEAMILWVVFKYRRRSDDEFPPQIHHNIIAEVTWVAIPLAIVVGLFIGSYVVLEDVTAAAEDGEPVESIDVLGRQWAWAFNYATPMDSTLEAPVGRGAESMTIEVSDGSEFRTRMAIRIGVEHMRVQSIDGNVLEVQRAVDGTVRQAHAAGSPIGRVFNGTETEDEGRLENAAQTPVVTVPVGRPIRFNIASMDVLHAFYTPQFLTKLDAVPGRVQTLWVTVTEPGFYQGQCAEFCGINHARMIFSVRALPAGEYDEWFESRIPPVGEEPPPPAEDGEDGQDGEQPEEPGAGDPDNGADLYFANGCNVCHGDNGEGGVGPTIASTTFTLEQEIEQYRNPRGSMPAFPEDRISDEEVADILAWLKTLPLPETIVPGEGTPQ